MLDGRAFGSVCMQAVAVWHIQRHRAANLQLGTAELTNFPLRAKDMLLIGSCTIQ